MNPSHTILAIDTAMNGCSVALYDKARGRFFERSNEMTRGHSETLMPMIEIVLNEANMTYQQIEKIAVTVGPGAFTGLRIGLSAAKALGMALEIPVVGLSTLDILARQYQDLHRTACTVLIETKRVDYYTCRYDETGKAVTRADAMIADDIAATLKPHSVVVGDAVGRFAQYHPGFTLYPIALPDAKVMCVMADDIDEGSVEPIYLRGADVTMPKKPARILSGS